MEHEGAQGPQNYQNLGFPSLLDKGYVVEVAESTDPHKVDCRCEEGDRHRSLVVLVIVEGGIREVLRPRVSSKSSHLLSSI